MEIFLKTGEGKTYSIAALSIYGAIRGHWVDIVTSSEELAGHMYEELKVFILIFLLKVVKELFSQIGITAATNIDHKAQKGNFLLMGFILKNWYFPINSMHFEN